MTKNELLSLSDNQLNKAVRIQGTDYDRRRKVTKEIKYRMQRMYDSGKDYKYIANHYGVAPNTVRRNLDESFRRNEDLARKYRARSSSIKDWRGLSLYKRALIERNKKLPAVN